MLDDLIRGNIQPIDAIRDITIIAHKAKQSQSKGISMDNKIVIDLTDVTREDVDAVIFAYLETLAGHEAAVEYDFSDINNELDYMEGIE